MSVCLSSRRRFLGQTAALGLIGASAQAWAEDPSEAPKAAPAPPAAAESPAKPTPDGRPLAEPEPPPPETTSATLPLAGGPKDRPLTKDFPQKGTMILQSTRPPVLETPFKVFDDDVFTPNNRFYVSWHWGAVPITVDTTSFRLAVRGNVTRPLSLSLSDLMTGFPKVEVAAVDQAAGNSRGLFQPRVPGIQWGNGAIGNAKWTGVRLRDVLDRAGVKPGTVQVRFNGMDQPVVPGAPDYMKSLELARAMNDETIIAFAMNGAPLPLLNGFPLRLVVPGWYANYWVKMLSDIELLTEPDDNYWMAVADRVPDTPRADVAPGAVGYRTVPLGRMTPRSFFTNLKNGDKLPPDKQAQARGIAFGGDNGVARVEFSSDGGQRWSAAKLGMDYGRYSFRQWETMFKPATGNVTLMVRCTSTGGVTQPDVANWNPSGLMRNVIESVNVVVGGDEAGGDDAAAQ
ncbi:MAG: sulfide dehydrogenase [Rhodospirillales bacterium]|nr:sulfide dehydrogenase [Rhodospirillales bacterium]